MNQEYLDKWSEVAKKWQEPLHDLIELNVKTLQGLTYLKPEDFTKVKSAEEMIEKQMAVVVENGHKALDYFEQSFVIVEKALKGAVKESKKAVKIN